VPDSPLGRRLEGVLFDLDDVLVPFHTPATWQWAWRPQGPVLSERRLRGALHRSLRRWDKRRWQGLTGALPPADLSTLEEHLVATLEEVAGRTLPAEESAAVARRLLHPTGAVELYADVAPALRRLRAAGTKLAVATPLPPESATWLLHRIGASDLELAISGASPGPGLPHRGAFRAAVERLGVPVESVAYVGDLLWSDVRAAHRAGLSSVLLDRSDTWPHVEAGRLRSLEGLEEAFAAGGGVAEDRTEVPPPGPVASNDDRANVYRAGPSARPVDGDP
jgi:FMN phosphatase YigB (HAD superfamily)